MKESMSAPTHKPGDQSCPLQRMCRNICGIITIIKLTPCPVRREYSLFWHEDNVTILTMRMMVHHNHTEADHNPGRTTLVPPRPAPAHQ